MFRPVLTPPFPFMQSDRAYMAPAVMDMAAFGHKRLASPDMRLGLDENAMSDRQSLQSIASSLEAASTALMSPVRCSAGLTPTTALH